MGAAAPHIAAVAEARIGGKLAFEVIRHQDIIDPDDKSKKCLDKASIKGEFLFKDVSFRYPSRQDQVVMNKLNVTIEAGKTTALVGPSGSGKSTVIQLLERFYDPTEGDIFLDGVSIKDVNLASMRKAMGYVSQEPVLFNASIRENMRFSVPEATEQEMITALENANAWDFVSNLPDKLDTHVGGAGGQLSGGQKQRVAIARAFLKKPKILLLDEATSALDKLSEAAVQDAIKKYREMNGGITIIVIAHRLSTIQDSDKILVIEKGNLVEEGNHDQIL